MNRLRNFKNSKRIIERSIPNFKEMLMLVKELKKNKNDQVSQVKTSLFLHSLGNYYLERSVKDNLLNEINGELFDNVIINAAAVNQKNHSDWVEQLDIQKRIYIISNCKDFNLKGVRIFTNSGKQLGERLKLPVSSKAYYINFTNVIGFTWPTHKAHTYFLNETTSASENIYHFYKDI